MAPKWTQRPKGGVLRRVLKKPVTKDEASRQSRSVEKRPAASKPNYVPEYQKLDSVAAQLQTLYKSKHLPKPSACPHCGQESHLKKQVAVLRCYATKCKKHVLPVSTSSALHTQVGLKEQVGALFCAVWGVRASMVPALVRGATGNVVRRV